jgi:hypothetical protein
MPDKANLTTGHDIKSPLSHSATVEPLIAGPHIRSEEKRLG